MRIKTTTLLFLTTLVISLITMQSCGPSADEIKQQEQHIIDSTRQATEAEAAAKQEGIERQKKLELALQKRENDKTAIDMALIRLSTRLQVEETKLQDVQQFKLLRTPVQKQQQINGQVAVVNMVKMKIEVLNEILQKIADGTDYQLYPSQLQ